MLDQLLVASRAGDEDRSQSLQYALLAATSVEGARAFFDLLLGVGHYAGNTDALPEDVRSAARKALRLAPDQESIGNLAAQYYLDPQVNGHEEALWELFDGVSNPSMLSALAVKAYQDGSPENAGQFLDRLGQTGDQGTVRAFVQAASQEPALLNAVGERLYA